MPAFTLAQVIEDYDMRTGIHTLREQAMKTLREGQCLLAYNGTGTIVKLFTANGLVSSWYKDREDERESSLKTLNQDFTQGLGFSLAYEQGKQRPAKAGPVRRKTPVAA